MTSGQRMGLRAHWPRYGLSLDDGEIDLTACFGRSARLVVEIGFGMGDSLAQMAARQRDQDYIGIEVHRPGVGHLMNLAAAAGLGNIRIFNADCVDVLQTCIPAAVVDRVQIFFPDPWQKKRHHKRRLLSADFCRLLVQKLAPGGILHVATDWPDYADKLVETMAETASLAVVSPPDRPETKYERRGLRLGHEVRDLAWQKACGQPVLPPPRVDSGAPG